MLLVLDLRGRVVDRLGLGMTYISRDVDCNSFSKVWRLLWPFHASCCRLKDRFSMNILMTCVCPPAGLFLHWIRTKMQQRSGYTQEVWILCSTNLNYSNVKSTCSRTACEPTTSSQTSPSFYLRETWPSENTVTYRHVLLQQTERVKPRAISHSSIHPPPPRTPSGQHQSWKDCKADAKSPRWPDPHPITIRAVS